MLNHMLTAKRLKLPREQASSQSIRRRLTNLQFHEMFVSCYHCSRVFLRIATAYIYGMSACSR